MNQLKTVSDYHTTLKQTRLGALNLFSSHEWMELNIKIGQSFITFFSCHLSFPLRFQKTLKTANERFQ